MTRRDTLAESLNKSRIIVIDDYINSDLATGVIYRLLTYSADDKDAAIQLYIASRGGSYTDIMAIYDTIMAIPNPVSGTCIGIVNDYTTLLLASCTKGRRFALRHSEITFEQPYGTLMPGASQQTEIKIESDELTREREIFENLLQKATSQPLSRIHADCETGINLTAEEALAYGIIDKIIE